MAVLVIETPEETRKDRRAARHFFTGQVADVLHQSETLREETLQSLSKNGLRYQIKASVLEAWASKIQSLFRQAAEIGSVA